VARIERFLESPDQDILSKNLEIARRDFNVENLASRLGRILEELGIKSTPLMSS
jgi:hypothetical protein